MIIAIDLDSVLNNLLDVWLREYNEKYEDTVSCENITTWSIHDHVKCGMEIYQLLTAELIQRTRPRIGSVEVTKHLVMNPVPPVPSPPAPYGNTLVVVSAVRSGTYDAKRAWLKQHFPHIKHFIATHDKHLVRCTVLIDDRVANLEKAKEWGIVPICFDQPYNRRWRGDRVTSWDEVPNVLSAVRRRTGR